MPSQEPIDRTCRVWDAVAIVLVGRNGASSPELVEMAEQGSTFFWTGIVSQVYAEARRLARLGYPEAEAEPARTRPRTRYTLTPRGLEAFREWARAPAPYPRIQHEASVRVFALDCSRTRSTSSQLRGARPRARPARAPTPRARRVRYAHPAPDARDRAAALVRPPDPRRPPGVGRRGSKGW